MLPFLLSIPALLATTGLAAPAPTPAPDVVIPEVIPALEPRAACPVTSRYEFYRTSLIYRETVTLTNGVSYLGRITSTKTENELRLITNQKTVFSPAVTTYPGTTSTTYTVAAPTSTVTWQLHTVITELPGYAPSSLCQFTTFTNIIPDTTTATITRDQTYETVWTTTTGHVLTKTEVTLTTTTRTVTTPGSTVYETTATVTLPSTPIFLTIATTTSTVYAQGCRSWACEA